MIDLIMDIVYAAFEKTSASGNGGSRSERRTKTMTAVVLAVLMLALSAYCLVRGWQTNDSYYIVTGFLCLSLTLLEIVRLIQRWRKH